MKEVRYFYVPNASTTNELPAEEAQHALKVLRLKAGDDMFLMDGEGTFYHAIVTLAAKHCMYEVKEILPQEKTWNGYIHLAIAPTKSIDRIEWMVEKATEIGVNEITFLDCKFSERKKLNMARLEKIVISAMKQSRKPFLPRLNALIPLKEFLQRPQNGMKCIAHCYDEVRRVDFFNSVYPDKEVGHVTIMIGPEGDFSIDEVQLAMEQGYASISLGNSRLRTETAGLFAVMNAQLALRK